MITTTRRLYAILASFLFLAHSYSQDLRSFNQNASRSNHTRLSISFSPTYSTPVNKSKDSLLFRGSGGGFRVGADYFFNKIGIGMSSGFTSSNADRTAINNFLKNASIPPDQLVITKSGQQNMYLLLGPSVRFGNTLQIFAQAKGGMFINNGGLVNIQQRGAVRAAYRNESTDKSIFPGFQAGFSLLYHLKSDSWSFGIGADYMGTRSQVTNYDARRGNGVEGVNISQPIHDIVVGIMVRYNIFSSRDQASGQSNGRRLLPTVNKREITSSRDVASGQSTGRLLPTVNKKEIAIDEPGVQRTSQSCGPVTTRTTNSDGTTEERTFACPKDAADYATRTEDLSNDPQTNSFSNTSEGNGIVSGRLTWASSASGGIITNKTIVTNNTQRGGSATLNSQSSSTRQTNQSSFGTIVRLSAREAGSGMATGRRQYEPIFVEGQNDVCNPCLAAATMSSVKNNPLYSSGGASGNNPLYNGDKRTTGREDEDCDGVAGADIFLIDKKSGSVIAKTKTEACGDFFFANVPAGNYVVRVSAIFAGKKGYDVYMKSKTDLLGDIKQSDDWMQLMINTNNNNGMSQKAGISTSRSNIRCKSFTIIEADLDGDGEFESTKVLADLYDGSTKDVTAFSRTTTTQQGKKVTVRGWNPEKKEAIAGSANTVQEYTISIDENNGAMLTNQYANGTKDETKVMAHVSHHPNVVQFVVPSDDADDNDPSEGDVKIKTKSNINSDRMAGSNVDGDGIWSPRSNIRKMIPVTTNETGGNDGIVTFGGGNLRTEFAVLRDRGKEKGYFETGDKPTQQQRTAGGAITSSVALRPGDPVPGIDVKLQQSSGETIMGTTQTNESGQFVFDNIKEGNYTITFGTNYYIDDETTVVVAGDPAENINTSESNVKGMTAKTDNPATNTTNNPVILDSRDDSKVIDRSDAEKTITLRWTPLVPKPSGAVTYRIRVWQLMQGQNEMQAMRFNKPVVEKTVINTTETSVQGILTGPCKPPYLCNFVWSVETISSDGKLLNTASTNNQGWGFSVR